MTNPEFKKLRSIFLSGLESCPEASITNTALFSNPMLTPGEMVMQDRLGDVAALVTGELAERFAQGGDARG